MRGAAVSAGPRYGGQPFCLRSHEEIDKRFPVENECCAELHAELERREAAAIDPELEAAETATNNTSDAEWRALQAIIATVPTTPGGLSAMLAYLLEPQMEDAVDQEDMKTVLKTLAVAVANISGE
jgi:hypothetical protein